MKIPITLVSIESGICVWVFRDKRARRYGLRHLRALFDALNNREGQWRYLGWVMEWEPCKVVELAEVIHPEDLR